MRTISTFIMLLIGAIAMGQTAVDSLMPVRGFCIAAPRPENTDKFVSFIQNELATRRINTLILRIDYHYDYKSHPELREDTVLSKHQLKRIAATCKENGINLIPQINLLGHQSWANKLHQLLKVYPQFDETPHVKIPEAYAWPNNDGLYCKSYCPLHPDVHKVVFDLVDELMEVCEAKDFHAGMDEVFYIGDDKCPRCSGHDKAELFAGEVTLIRNHLAANGYKFWIWGDRLIDGQATGLGMWEASMNNTHRAIDLIPKDVTICDWHYVRPDKTAVYFAMKGFNVATTTWNNHEVSDMQAKDMIAFRRDSNQTLKKRFQGIIVSYWGRAGRFIDNFYEPVEYEKVPTAAYLKVFDNLNNQNIK